MYEVMVDHWGAQAPFYDYADTFTPSMLPERDLAHFEHLGVIQRVPEGDPRRTQPPTGPTGSAAGSDGWATRYSPEPLPRRIYLELLALGGPLVTGDPPPMIPEVPWSPGTVDERPKSPLYSRTSEVFPSDGN